MKKIIIVIGILLIVAVVLIFVEREQKNKKMEQAKLEELAKQMQASKSVQETPKPKPTTTLSESKRKEIFKALLDLQDEYLEKYPGDNNKQQEAYRTIAQRYKISEKKMREIAVEGAQKGWIYQ